MNNIVLPPEKKHERDNPDCWCDPIEVQHHEHADMVIHRGQDQWPDDHGNMPCQRDEEDEDK